MDEVAQVADLQKFGAFDFAVPINWQLENPGVRAVWFYDKKAGLCGRPLFLTTILRLARRKCQDNWMGMKIQAALDSYKKEAAARIPSPIAA